MNKQEQLKHFSFQGWSNETCPRCTNQLKKIHLNKTKKDFLVCSAYSKCAYKKLVVEKEPVPNRRRNRKHKKGAKEIHTLLEQIKAGNRKASNSK